MDSLKEAPTFNLKAVVQETGLKPDTLRAWERRYGLPQPERTPGGHRLYSRHDIELLKWLMARQEEGLSISRAVELWHRLEEEGRTPLLVRADVALNPDRETTLLAVGEAVHDLRQAWIDACTDFDEQRAEQILSQAFALYPVETVCLQVISRGMSEIGAGWYEGNISVQQEHFASALAMRRLDALLAATPNPTRPGRMMVLCAPEDTHTFSPLLITLLLRRRGYDVTYLGGNVPTMQLESALQAARIDLAIISAQQLPTAANLADVATLLGELAVPVAYGGLIFNTLPELRQHIPGHFLGESLEQIPARVEQLLLTSPDPPPVRPVGDAYRETLRLFQRRRARIEAQVWELQQESRTPEMHLTNANYHLARNIDAALRLGDIRFLGEDIEWVRGLLVNYQVPVEQLTEYLRAYAEAARSQLGEGGRVITDWLESLFNNNSGNG